MTHRVFLLRSYRSWILGAIIRDSSEAINRRISIAYVPEKLSDFFSTKIFKFIFAYLTWRNKNILIVNQSTLFRILQLNFQPRRLSNISVFYTHDSDKYLAKNIQKEILNQVSKVFVFNRNIKKELIRRGVDSKILEVVYGAIDRKIFRPISLNEKVPTEVRHGTYVLIAGNCNIRKSPELIFNVIRSMPDLKFVIHGNGWDKFIWPYETPNLEIFNFDFELQPLLIRHASVYLTLSKLEGGPYPTLEALASGTPVVATDTGWNSEVIGINQGIVLPIDPDIQMVILSIRYCIKLKSKIKYRDLLNGHFRWDELGIKLFGRVDKGIS